MDTSLNLERPSKSLRNQQLKASQFKPGTTMASQLVPSSLVFPLSPLHRIQYGHLHLPQIQTEVMRPIPQHKIPNGTQMPIGKSEAKPRLLPSSLFNSLSRCSPAPNVLLLSKQAFPTEVGKTPSWPPRALPPWCTPPSLECGQDPRIPD